MILIFLNSFVHFAFAESEPFITTPNQVITDRGEHFCYEIEDGHAILTQYWLEADKVQPAVIQVPDTLNGYPLTVIGGYAFDNWDGFLGSEGWQRFYNGSAVERIISLKE